MLNAGTYTAEAERGGHDGNGGGDMKGGHEGDEDGDREGRKRRKEGRTCVRGSRPQATDRTII